MIHKTRGFTLVELIIVVVVLAVLATIITLSSARILEDSRDKQRASSASVLSESLEKYFINNGRYPSCSALQGSPEEVQKVLGVDKDVIKTPTSTSENAISCTDITADTPGDTYAYIGDGSTECNSGGGCLSYTLKYKSESTSEISAIESRKNGYDPTTGSMTLRGTAASSSSISLTWNPVIDATEYELQRATNSSFTNSLVTSVYSAPDQTITGLATGITYHFRVRAIDALTNTLGLSNAVAVTTTIPTPTGLSVTTNSLSQITAQWSAVPGVSTYRLQYATSSNFSNAQTINGITSTSRAVTGLTEATLYYFRVYAIVGSNASSASSTVNTRTAVRAPTGVGVTTNSSTQVTVRWSSVTNAASYRVQYSTASDFSGSSTLSNITSTSRAVTGLSPSTLYYFRVYAVAGSTVSLASSSVSTRTAVPTPTGVGATTNSLSQVTIDWNSVTNASSYRVEYSTSSSFADSNIVSGITSTSRAVTGLEEATLYYFRVYAVAGSTVSLPSSAVSTRTAVRTPTGFSASSNGNTSISTSWNSVTGASSYRIEYSTSSSFADALTVTTTATSRNVGALSQGEQYFLRVYAVAGSTSSLASSSANAITTIARPSPLSVDASSTGSGTSDSVTWSWDAISCPAGTSARYSTALYRDDSTGWRSWTGDITSTSRAQSTNYEGYLYRIKARARCVTNHEQSEYSTDSNAPSFIRLIDKPGGVTNVRILVEDEPFSGGGTMRWLKLQWTPPQCGLGTTGVKSFEGAGGDDEGGNANNIWKDAFDLETSQKRWKATTFPISMVDWNKVRGLRTAGNPNSMNIAPDDYYVENAGVYESVSGSKGNIVGWSPVNVSSADWARGMISYACVNTDTKRYGYYGPLVITSVLRR